MIWLHALKEAYQSVLTHKTRTLAMGFGVSLAICMLQLLLAIGNSLHKGISERFAKYGEKTMWIYPGEHNGKSIPLPTELVVSFAKQFSAIQHIAFQYFGPNKSVTFANKTIRSYSRGLDYQLSIANIQLQEGRFFTARDVGTTTPICILGATIKQELFGKTAAVGKSILLGNKDLKVIGVLDDADHLRAFSDEVILESSLLLKLMPQKNLYVDLIRLTLMPTINEEVAEKQFRSYFARHLDFDPNNKTAIFMFVLARFAAKFHRLFKNLSIANWIMGVFLLITGIVSLSNMILVTIQERTQEIAIRRVLGGSIATIIAMVVWEVLLVTMIAGILGFISSFTLMQLLNTWVIPACKNYLFTTLVCPFEVILNCLGMLCLTSCLASILPAVRAIRIKPVTALSSKS